MNASAELQCHTLGGLSPSVECCSSNSKWNALTAQQLYYVISQNSLRNKEPNNSNNNNNVQKKMNLVKIEVKKKVEPAKALPHFYQKQYFDRDGTI